MKKTFTRFLTHCKDDGIFQRSCLMISFVLNTAIARANNIVAGQLNGEKKQSVVLGENLVETTSDNVTTRKEKYSPAFL